MVYGIKRIHPRRGERNNYGTIEELSKYFGITPMPKTIKSLVNKIQDKYAHREGCCYDRTHVEVIL